MPVHVYGGALELYQNFLSNNRSLVAALFIIVKKKRKEKKQTEVVNELPYVRSHQPKQIIGEYHTMEPCEMQKCSIAVMPSVVATGHV